jgi:serine/threonine protein kinase
VGQNKTVISTNNEDLYHQWEKNLSKSCVIVGNAKKDYNITDKLLGKGGFAEVYECRQKSSSEIFAVKVILKNPLIENPHKLVNKLFWHVA